LTTKHNNLTIKNIATRRVRDMRKTISGLGFASLFILGTVATSLAGGVNIYVTPPPPPVVVPVPPPPPAVMVPAPPPPRPVAVFPPLPPGVVITPGPPAYWFWDDGRAEWFYYDVDHRPHYSRRHIYVDDGRHFYMEGRRWRPGHEDMGRHKGWYKHQEKFREKERKHEEKEWKKEHKGRGRGRD
jgi:hypothetical protein